MVHDHQQHHENGKNISEDSLPVHTHPMLDEKDDSHQAPSEPAQMEHKHAHPAHEQSSTRESEKSHAESETHAGHEGTHINHSGHEDMFRHKFWVSLLLAIPILLYSSGFQELLGFSMPKFPGSDWVAPFFGLIIYLYGGLPFLKMAKTEFKEHKPGMMSLISLAITVAFIYSFATLFLPDQMDFFWELATLIVIMLLGHWIELRSVRQASGSLNELAKLIPDSTDRILGEGSTETVLVSQLGIGDLVLVRPGASIPADGKIMEGESSVNEAMITGESKPVHKLSDDHVIAGSINGDGSLRVRVTATGEETALAGIMRLVNEAQQSKSPTQLLADKAAGWLFYIALGVAAITAIVWTIATGFNVFVLERVATVLVIACPHALGLAIPLVVSITTSKGASNGILIRDRLALEKIRNVNAVIFDKTGTLTKGSFGVVASISTPLMSKSQALALAAAVEGDSEHTIAKAIREKAEENNLKLPAIHSFEALQGRGILSHSEQGRIYLGGPRLLEMLQINLTDELAQFEHQASGKGQSVVHLVQAGHDGSDPKAVASFALADEIRPESNEAVKELKDLGIEVAMLTGDSQGVADAVAQELGITTYFAEVLPENKDAKVKELQSQGKLVAMVGDGINDAPALTRADVGIAIGSGTDVAIESAGIILVKNNPLDVVKTITLSRASYKKMIENLVWATGYNAVALPLAAGVLAPVGILLSPAVGALLMSLSTIIVALNSQLLRRLKL
ncbi:MAG: copper-translocating P-type ATPase [Anaerolineaceae bacterium]